MSLKSFIEGMNILIKYYNDHDGHHIGAEHDEVFFYRTDHPVSPEDCQKLYNLGWYQVHVDQGEDGDTPVYDQEESWCFMV